MTDNRQLWEQIASSNPMRRLDQPSEIADAAYVAGLAPIIVRERRGIPVDGGFSAA